MVENYAVSFLKNVFQLRKFVADLGLALFAIDEIIDHAALDRTGAVQRVERGEILDAAWLVTAENIAHAVGFELEDGGRFSASEEFVGFGVVQREIVDVNFYATVLFHHANSVVEHGERGQAKKVHLQKADALKRIHVVLRGDFIAIGLVERNDVRERRR